MPEPYRYPKLETKESYKPKESRRLHCPLKKKLSLPVLGFSFLNAKLLSHFTVCSLRPLLYVTFNKSRIPTKLVFDIYMALMTATAADL